MSAQGFDIGTIVIPDPAYDSSPNTRVLNSTLGFRVHAGNLIRTLSPNNPNNYDIIRGFLYVPRLDDNSPCVAEQSAIIPQNVTRLSDFAPGNMPFVALAPWTSVQCTREYFSSMGAYGPRAAIFFHNDNGTTQPPPVSESSWGLEDGGEWRGVNRYPVYAIAGALGNQIMQQLALYSGNISSAPHGADLARIYDIHDTVRLFTQVDVNQTAGIPSLWVFLIIVLAILLGVVLCTSMVMHFIQRRQRRALQRRVASGEIDLEVLGIKKLNVPQDVLDKMPLYTYTVKADATTPALKSGPLARQVPFSQPVCPICLDDFVEGETTVRELPCNHIYHPECVDNFLKDNSSLCPMCKKSALPVGFCAVRITNLHVRRERLVRRARERREAGYPPPESTIPTAVRNGFRRVRSMSTANGTAQNPTSASGAHSAPTEMTTNRRQTMAVLQTVPPEVQAQGRSAVRAWRRDQVARQQELRYHEREAEVRNVDVSRPLWRRMAGRVFPNLE